MCFRRVTKAFYSRMRKDIQEQKEAMPMMTKYFK